MALIIRLNLYFILTRIRLINKDTSLREKKVLTGNHF